MDADVCKQDRLWLGVTGLHSQAGGLPNSNTVRDDDVPRHEHGSARVEALGPSAGHVERPRRQMDSWTKRRLAIVTSNSAPVAAHTAHLAHRSSLHIRSGRRLDIARI